MCNMRTKHIWVASRSRKCASGVLHVVDRQTRNCKGSNSTPLLLLKTSLHKSGDCSISPITKGWESWDCSAWRRVFSGGPYQCILILRGGCREDRARLFSVVPSDRTRGNGHKLIRRRFTLNISKHLVTVSVNESWPRLPTEVVESPSLEMFNSCLDVVLGNVI